MMRERCDCERLVSTISTSINAEVNDQHAPRGARKCQQDRQRYDAEGDRAAERLAELVRDDALQREQRRQDQERAEHVRVLEGAAGAVIQRQQVAPAGDEIEVARDAGERRDHGADDEAAPEHVEPRRGILGDDHREEDDRDRHVPGGRDPVRNVGPVHHRDRGDAVADVEQEQEQQQRYEHQPHPQARCEEDQRGGKRRQLIGRGFDEDDGAGRADQPDQRALQGKHAGRGRHRW